MTHVSRSGFIDNGFSCHDPDVLRLCHAPKLITISGASTSQFELRGVVAFQTLLVTIPPLGAAVPADRLIHVCASLHGTQQCAGAGVGNNMGATGTNVIATVPIADAAEWTIAKGDCFPHKKILTQPIHKLAGLTIYFVDSDGSTVTVPETATVQLCAFLTNQDTASSVFC